MKVEKRIPLELEGLFLALSMLSIMATSILNFQSQIKNIALTTLIIISSGLIIDLIIRSSKIKNVILKLLIGATVSTLGGLAVIWSLKMI